MLKILTIHGSPHKGQTYKATMEFFKELGDRMEFEVKHIFLFQELLDLCRGCGTCMVDGEEKCPNRDGLMNIHAKIQDSDAVIITTPIYALHVSALVKNFLERSAYIMHRPCYFGKWFMSISTQVISGDKDVAKYLMNVMHFWGFNIIPSLCLTTLPENHTTKQEKVFWKRINRAVDYFLAIEKKSRFPDPKFKDFMMFRFRRTVMGSNGFSDIFPRDFDYFKEKGWLSAPYYYDVHLNPFMKVWGRFFDAVGRKMTKNGNQ